MGRQVSRAGRHAWGLHPSGHWHAVRERRLPYPGYRRLFPGGCPHRVLVGEDVADVDGVAVRQHLVARKLQEAAPHREGVVRDRDAPPHRGRRQRQLRHRGGAPGGGVGRGGEGRTRGEGGVRGSSAGKVACRKVQQTSAQPLAVPLHSPWPCRRPRGSHSSCRGLPPPHCGSCEEIFMRAFTTASRRVMM